MTALRVMQSFRAPRSTTNPYITMLDHELTESVEIDHLRFDWIHALIGRYDVFHWHWPEGKLHGSTWWKSVGKCILTALLFLRHRMSRRIAVIRTVHNVDLPDDNAIRRWLLVRIDRHTDYRITLNTTTQLRKDQPFSLILHGHYRDWYSRWPHADRVHGRVGTFGGVRRYKSVETLVDAYAMAVIREPELSLRVGGRPSSSEIARDLQQRAAEVPGVQLQLSFLSDEELVELATSSELVVLAYRFMHNSGSVLAALSLDRPVLVPKNAANEALGQEVGADWVLMYDGELDADNLLEAWRKASSLGHDDRPDLSRRDWATAGPAHARAYRAAAAVKGASLGRPGTAQIANPKGGIK